MPGFSNIDRAQFRRQLQEGLDNVLCATVEKDFRTGKYIATFRDGTEHEVTEDQAAHFRRRRERYAFGWQPPTNPHTGLPEQGPRSHVVEEPRIEIRWWHRVIYFFYKIAKRCL